MIEMSIAWHEKSLENQMQVLIKLRRESDNAALKYQAALYDYIKYQKQIERAKELGLNKFNKEVFNNEKIH